MNGDFFNKVNAVEARIPFVWYRTVGILTDRLVLQLVHVSPSTQNRGPHTRTLRESKYCSQR